MSRGGGSPTAHRQDRTPFGVQAPRYVIHLAFSTNGGDEGGANVLYALTSSLLHAEAAEEVLTFEFDEGWECGTGPSGRVGARSFRLPRDNTAAHRIVVAEAHTPRSILVTGLASQSLFQLHGGSF